MLICNILHTTNLLLELVILNAALAEGGCEGGCGCEGDSNTETAERLDVDTSSSGAEADAKSDVDSAR